MVSMDTSDNRLQLPLSAFHPNTHITDKILKSPAQQCFKFQLKLSYDLKDMNGQGRGQGYFRSARTPCYNVFKNEGCNGKDFEEKTLKKLIMAGIRSWNQVEPDAYVWERPGLFCFLCWRISVIVRHGFHFSCHERHLPALILPRA